MDKGRALNWVDWTADAPRLREAAGAMLFDLDGTLVDTLPLHHRAYAEVLARYGVDLTYEQYRCNGAAPARVSIPRFIVAAGADPAALPEVGVIHAAKKARMAEILPQMRPPRLPAAAELELARGRRPLGLVTSAARTGAEMILRGEGWSEVFEVVVSGDDVARGKPDPEPYLAAARALGRAPSACLVFEDAPEGIAAGLAAGMTVVDVTAAGDADMAAA